MAAASLASAPLTAPEEADATTDEQAKLQSKGRSAVKKKAMRGSFWTIMSFGSGQVLRLGSNLILTRILVPEDFGMMALVNVFIHSMMMFSDLGIIASIVRSEHGDEPRFLRTAFTIQVIRGFVMWGICAALAFPTAWYYEQPQLALLIIAASTFAVFDGFRSTKTHTASRHLDLLRLSGIEILGTALGIAVTIALAGMWHSVWALAIGSALTAAIRTVLSYVALPGETYFFGYDREAARELINFGKWIIISTACFCISKSLDRFMLPALCGIEALGFYSLARIFSDAITMLTAKLSSSVIYPSYVRMREHGMEEAEVYRKISRVIPLVLIGPLSLSLVSHLLISTLYEARYLPIADALKYLCFASCYESIKSIRVGILLSQGNSKGSALVNTLWFLTLLVLGPPLSNALGIEGFCVAVVASVAVGYLYQGHVIRKTIGPFDQRYELIAMLMMLLTALALSAPELGLV